MLTYKVFHFFLPIRPKININQSYYLTLPSCTNLSILTGFFVIKYHLGHKILSYFIINFNVPNVGFLGFMRGFTQILSPSMG